MVTPENGFDHSRTSKRMGRIMSRIDDGDTGGEAVERRSKWHSGDSHVCLEQHGVRGCLPRIFLFNALEDGLIVCAPAVAALYACGPRTNQPQDVYHNALDNIPEGDILVVGASCTEGSCPDELMSKDAKIKGPGATAVNGTVRDIAQVCALGYPLFARGPVSTSGKMKPDLSQIPLTIDDVTIEPGNVIFADSDAVVVAPKHLLKTIADACGNAEGNCRDRVLNGEKLQSV